MNHFATKSRRMWSFSVIFGCSALMSLRNDPSSAARARSHHTL